MFIRNLFFAVLIFFQLAFAELLEEPVFESGLTDGAVSESFENGKVKIKYKVKNGKVDGLYIQNYENGKPKFKISYRKGLKYGSYKSYFDNGKMQIQKHYKNDVLHGKHILYDVKGKVTVQRSYYEGKLFGKYLEYENRKVSEDKFYFNDILLLPKPVSEIKKNLKVILKPSSKIIAVNKKSAGKDFSKGQLGALNLLKAYRYLCDLDYEHITLNEEQNTLAHAASVICERLGTITHTPHNPGMKDDKYKVAKCGAAESNLSMGGDIVSQVTMFMDDSDASNISAVGHRRWCLNPRMNQVGFGQKGKFAAMYAFDSKYANYKDYDAICYPSKGYMPSEYFSIDYAWSVTPNPKKYQLANKDKVKVNLHPVKIPARKMKPNKSIKEALKIGKAIELDYFNVSPGGYGVKGAIIFKPKKLSLGKGKGYFVEITGLKKKDGSDAKFEYYVEFI